MTILIHQNPDHGNHSLSLVTTCLNVFSCVVVVMCRASDISRKKKQNFAGFSGQIRGKIGRFRGILAKKSQISKDFQGQILRNFGEKLRQETISKKQPISLDFFGKFR